MTGSRRWLVALTGALASSCAHPEPERAPRKNAPRTDVAALEPCPAGMVTKSVREVLAQKWPRRLCFGVRGRLTATYGNTPILNYLSGGLGTRGDPAGVPASSAPPVHPIGWVLTDLADPFSPRRDDHFLDAQPTISLSTATDYEPTLLPLQRCNRNDEGRPIMPARTRLELPGYRMTDVDRLNNSLAGLTVGVFGGKGARDFAPDKPERFDVMMVTHICRLEAPPDAGAQDGD